MDRSRWLCGYTPFGLLQATLLVVVCGLSGSCADTSPDIESGVSGTPGPVDDAGGQAHTRSDADAGATGLRDAADTDAAVATPTCEGVDEDLGVLSTDEPTVVSRNLRDLTGPAASCTQAGESRGEYVFAFEVEEVAILDASVSAATTDTIAFGLYQDDCTGEAETYCSNRSPWRAIVEPGQTYFLKVQAGEDTVGKTFNVSFGFDEAACIPGETTCAEATSNRCVQGTSVETYQCAQGCNDGQSCAGDLCDAALTVEPVVGGAPISVDGDRWAYSHQWNAAELTDCEATTAIETGQTTSMELFLRVPNLESGQTLDIAAVGESGSYLYFVLDDCGAQTCRESMFVDAAGDNRLVWEVTQDGDYIVVIEALSDVSRAFHFDVALR